MCTSTRSPAPINPPDLSSSRTHSPTSSWNGRQIALLAGCCVILGGGAALSVLTMNPGPFLVSVMLVMSIGGAAISSGATLPQSNSPKPTAAPGSTALAPPNPENFRDVLEKAKNILKEKKICPDIENQFTFISPQFTNHCDESYYIAQAIIILNKANSNLVIANNVSLLFEDPKYFAETLHCLYKKDPKLITQENLRGLVEDTHLVDAKRGSFVKKITSGA